MKLIDKIAWDKLGGLIPAITQDIKTGNILMQAFINKEALELTLTTNNVHYFSRSKNRVWEKGEKSGHKQKVIEIFLDCDLDSILIKVEQIGVACHTGNSTCFFNKINKDKTIEETQSNKLNVSEIYDVFDTLFDKIKSKKNDDPNISYTALLHNKGANSIGKKIVEEAAELSFAIKDMDTKEIIYESADLLYHTLVGLSFSNVSLDEVRTELLRRFNISGIEEKKSRNK